MWFGFPNMSVITTKQTFKKQGFKIFIFSGRLDNSKDVTIKWLKYWDVPFDKLLIDLILNKINSHQMMF